MKLGVVIISTVVLLSAAHYTLQEPSQETALSSSQAWQDEYQAEEYRGEKEEENAEDGPQRRARGKRRRRMRKRQRVQPADEVDRMSDTEQPQEGTYERALSEDEGVTPDDIPRRRAGKRRRRPHRRYQDDGASGKPLRRRRKGGRKKVRPETLEEPSQTEIPEELLRNDEPDELETTTQMVRTTPSTTTTTTVKTEETKPTEIPKVITTITSRFFKKEESQDIKIASNVVKPENEEIEKTFGSKIFDRKKLFSNPRRTLPITSAVIRKLGPNIKENKSDTLPPLTGIKEKPELKFIDKTVIKTNFLVDGTTNLPKEIKPEKLVHSENKIQNLQQSDDTEKEDEEPNYPKIIPRPVLYRIKKPNIVTTPATTEMIETINQTEKQPELSTKRSEMSEVEFEKNIPETSTAPAEPGKLSTNKTMTEMEFEKMLENVDVETFNLTHFDDYILDLLQSKNGKEHLSKILELRNMTITQLLEHRERGSSKFHLFEMFPQKKNTERPTETTTTASTTTTSKTSTTEEPLKIHFPSEEILGSFPKFVKEEIERYEQKDENKTADIETEASVIRESREPRVFDSMPEFTTLSVTSTTKDDQHPTWRIIPNPKLRPVSVRGNYREIPVSHVLNRPLENNVNEIYVVDERDALIHHKKYGIETLDVVKTKDIFGHFKKIPVGVKSAIIISGIILAVATFGFLSLLISCRVRQKRSILRAKQDMMCEHLQNDDFMTSQQSLSPVLTKQQQAYIHAQEHHSLPHNRHYYLWRTIRRTFRYD